MGYASQRRQIAVKHEVVNENHPQPMGSNNTGTNGTLSAHAGNAYRTSTDMVLCEGNHLGKPTHFTQGSDGVSQGGVIVVVVDEVHEVTAQAMLHPWTIHRVVVNGSYKRLSLVVSYVDHSTS